MSGTPAWRPPPSEVPKLGTGRWPVEAAHDLLSVLNGELVRLLDAMPTEGHDTKSTGDGTCTVCGPHLAALGEHQRHLRMVTDYLVVRARAAHWGNHGNLTRVAERGLAEAESALRALLSDCGQVAWGRHPRGCSPAGRDGQHCA